MSGRVLIASGGTGGHMFPALALADELIARGREVVLVVDERGRRWVEGDYDVHVVAAAAPALGTLGRAAGVARGLAQCVTLVRSARPAAAACFGGYASFPPAMAARLAGRPILLHEQNAVLGKANRMIARFARKVALSFARTDHAEPFRDRIVVTGNPVRAAFRAVQAARRADDRIRLFVMGGSQGAAVFSTVLPDAIARLTPELRARLSLVQQARVETLDEVRQRYAVLGVEAELSSFFTDVPERLAACDLVIARSGASTVAEVTALGRPAILIPYRFAADDHQRVNAERVAAAGAAIVLPEVDATPERLARAIEQCTHEPGQLTAMALAAAAFARPDATQALADLVMTLSEKRA